MPVFFIPHRSAKNAVGANRTKEKTKKSANFWKYRLHFS